mmetsp:Transcript_2143/g.4996  ORF Transcript_2143/g.4996 Transcript_2143/m.4996 type:complete len:696 (+) Transcript_2143:125-2212(+)
MAENRTSSSSFSPSSRIADAAPPASDKTTETEGAPRAPLLSPGTASTRTLRILNLSGDLLAVVPVPANKPAHYEPIHSDSRVSSLKHRLWALASTGRLLQEPDAARGEGQEQDTHVVKQICVPRYQVLISERTDEALDDDARLGALFEEEDKEDEEVAQKANENVVVLRLVMRPIRVLMIHGWSERIRRAADIADTASILRALGERERAGKLVRRFHPESSASTLTSQRQDEMGEQTRTEASTATGAHNVETAAGRAEADFYHEEVLATVRPALDITVLDYELGKKDLFNTIQYRSEPRSDELRPRFRLTEPGSAEEGDRPNPLPIGTMNDLSEEVTNIIRASDVVIVRTSQTVNDPSAILYERSCLDNALASFALKGGWVMVHGRAAREDRRYVRGRGGLEHYFSSLCMGMPRQDWMSTVEVAASAYSGAYSNHAGGRGGANAISNYVDAEQDRDVHVHPPVPNAKAETAPRRNMKRRGLVAYPRTQVCGGGRLLPRWASSADHINPDFDRFFPNFKRDRIFGNFFMMKSSDRASGGARTAPRDSDVFFVVYDPQTGSTHPVVRSRAVSAGLTCGRVTVFSAAPNCRCGRTPQERERLIVSRERAEARDRERAAVVRAAAANDDVRDGDGPVQLQPNAQPQRQEEDFDRDEYEFTGKENETPFAEAIATHVLAAYTTEAKNTPLLQLLSSRPPS